LAGCSFVAADGDATTTSRGEMQSPRRVAAVATSPAQRAPIVQPMPLPRRPGFEVNQGQWPAIVSHAARDGGATLFLTPSEAVWRFVGSDSERAAGTRAVRMRWLDANLAPAIVASGCQDARVN
jgi:hypothetical protein